MGAGSLTDPIDSLPGALAEIARATSLKAALQLARDFGGTHVWIPEHPTPDTRLARCVGLSAARKISQVLGRGSLLVPLGPLSHGARKHAAIARELGKGKSASQVARDQGCHLRTVRRHRRRIRDTASTPLLDLIEDD